MELLEKKEELNSLIDKATSIYIMGHKYLDLDALGGSIGIYEYVKSKRKNATIIINDQRFEKGVKKVLDEFKKDYNVEKGFKIKNQITKNSLLIIVDTNKEHLLQDDTLPKLFNNIVVIDHHDPNEQSMTNGLIIIDRITSSTCEMLTDLLDKEKVEISSSVATLLLSGIVLDTNNYVIKTNANTYRASYLLAMQGADPLYVQYLLKQDIKKYVERQKVITNVKQIKNIAISCGKSTIKYRREDLAKISDTLLQFDKIEASFVIGRLEDNSIGISARSIGKVDVGKILEKFNGGGDENEAGARIEKSSIRTVEEKLKSIIKTLK